ncbi:hypothetical protein D3C75_963070 [compost metagenome]
MMTVNVSAPVMSSVNNEVRIISRLSGIILRTWRSIHAPKMAAINTPIIFPRGSMPIPKKLSMPEKYPTVAFGE